MFWERPGWRVYAQRARAHQESYLVYACACEGACMLGLFGMCCPLVATASSCSKWSWRWPPSGGRQLEAELVVNFFSSFLVISRLGELSVEVMSIPCKCLSTVKMELIYLFIFYKLSNDKRSWVVVPVDNELELCCKSQLYWISL